MFFRTRLKPFTGFIEEVAVYRFVVLFAVACICLVLAGSAGAQTFSCPTGTEDMLNYFVMKYPDRADYYMGPGNARSEEHTSELQSLAYLVCRLLLEKKKKKIFIILAR